MLTRRRVRCTTALALMSVAVALGACQPEELTCVGTGGNGLMIRVEDAASRQNLDSLSSGRIDRLTPPVASAEGPLWPVRGAQHPARTLETDVWQGTYRITVSSPGYRTEQVTVDVRSRTGCIGEIPVVVRLTRVP